MSAVSVNPQRNASSPTEEKNLSPPTGAQIMSWKMTYWLVNIGMTLSVVAFATGYYFRKNVARHRLWMSLGVGTNLVSAAVLVVSIHAFHGGDMIAAGFFPLVPPWAILVHRLVASLTAALMLAQAATGILRLRAWHLRFQRVLIPAYLVVYISGLLIFTNGPV